MDSDGYGGGVTQASSLQWELATFDTPQVPENLKNLDIRTLVRRSGKLYHFNTIPPHNPASRNLKHHLNKYLFINPITELFSLGVMTIMTCDVRGWRDT